MTIPNLTEYIVGGADAGKNQHQMTNNSQINQLPQDESWDLVIGA